MEEKFISWPITKLRLDPDNPRLPGTVGKTQEEILDYIARKTSIEDLMSAIGENGFFEGEALIVYQHPKDKTGVYRVIEGNRRLTAVKLLSDPSLCPKKTIIEIARNAEELPPEALPVILFDSREEILPYLGSRHIVGVNQWESLAKAKYMEQLFNSQTNKRRSPLERYKDVARSIGSRADFIKRNLDALAVYKVIEEEDFFGIEDLNEENISFSFLSTLITYKEVANFLGTGKFKANGDFEPLDPIVNTSVLKIDRIEELSRWMFEKDEKGNTRLGESRNLKKLAPVIGTPKALASLRSGAALEYAYNLTQGVDNEFLESMNFAKNYLHAASSIMANTHPDNAHANISEQVLELARTIKNVIIGKLKNTDD